MKEVLKEIWEGLKIMPGFPYWAILITFFALGLAISLTIAFLR